MSTPTLSSPPDAIPGFTVRPSSPALVDAVSSFWMMRLERYAPHLVPRTFGNRPLVVLGPEGLGDDTTRGFPLEYRHQLLTPDGLLEIHLHLPLRTSASSIPVAVDSRAYGCVLMPARHTLDVAFHIPSSIFTIRFHPGGARDFLPTSLHTLADRAIPLEELWGAAAHDFANEAAVESEITTIAEIAERYLLAHRREPTASTAIVRRCVERMQQTHGGLPLDELQEESGLTERQLERLFKEYIGVSPKRLSRTLRFDYLLSAMRNPNSVDWHDLIVALNYCDQPHMIREFREFIGLTPAMFRNEMKRHLERKQRMAGRD